MRAYRSGEVRLVFPATSRERSTGQHIRHWSKARKIQGAAYATHVGMTQVAAITAEEGHLIEQCPLAEPRLKVLGDTFTGVVASEIADLGW